MVQVHTCVHLMHSKHTSNELEVKASQNFQRMFPFSVTFRASYKLIYTGLSQWVLQEQV